MRTVIQVVAFQHYLINGCDSCPSGDHCQPPRKLVLATMDGELAFSGVLNMTQWTLDV